MALNERLDYAPTQSATGAADEQAQTYYEEELEINDFPQQLRYRVCSRESIGQVCKRRIYAKLRLTIIA